MIAREDERRVVLVLSCMRKIGHGKLARIDIIFRFFVLGLDEMKHAKSIASKPRMKTHDQSQSFESSTHQFVTFNDLSRDLSRDCMI